MLEEISIRDLGVISQSRIELGAGLNVLTGETGAGKTMILTALGLLLGERADSSSVRHGANQTVVEGHWMLPSEVQSVVAERLSEAGIENVEPEFLVSRTVSADGRSRAAAASRAVSAGVLAELAEHLVVVHGQSDQLRLKSANAQREALDAFAGAELKGTLDQYVQTYESFKSGSQRLDNLRAHASDRSRQAEEVRAAVAELEQIDPQPGEDQKLAELAERLGNTEEIRALLAQAHEALSSDNIGESSDAIGLIAIARRAIENGSNFDSRLSQVAEQLAEIGAQVRDVATEIASSLSGIESDSELSLDQIQERRAQIASLMRRFGPSLDDVIAYRQKAAQLLLDLDSSDYQIEQLEAEVESQHQTAIELASKITALRTSAAERLASEVTSELHALAMPGATLVVQVTEVELNSFGADQVAILLSSYAGAEPRPLGKGASGGELSRIMLAIEVVLAQGKTTPTFIFDEVDAGVGGAAAIEIGKRLARLAKQAQVIVVTHLAQVAAFADNHLRVTKTEGEFTESSVVKLSDIGRVDELARMLSGLEDSQLARGHAAELWQIAKHS
ncbi:MAG: DNA repair protein RecN [Micrococcales bacterium]